ncbi:MAG: hypothetical protein K0Q79_808 [Flavipsychrobacter sp.]|jgi:hypothetical protein|nr:hypothetical protein [Flavipsychrobacter sp.]
MERRSALILLVLAIAALSCRRSSTNNTPVGVYKGVVLHSLCCQNVIQVIDNDSLGIDNWIDSNAMPYEVRNNVFTVANACQFGFAPKGDTISFKIIPQEVQNCACCLIYVHTPRITYPVRVLY